MTFRDCSLLIRLDREFVPLVLVPITTLSGVAAELGLRIEQMNPVGDDVVNARVDVPPGEWLVWLRAGRAMWIGDRADALPAPLRRRLDRGDGTEVLARLTEFVEVGVWVREAALLIDGTWTSSRRAAELFGDVAPASIVGLNGIFVDRDGRSARLQLAPGGVAWSDRPTLAVQWMLGVARLPAPQ